MEREKGQRKKRKIIEKDGKEERPAPKLKRPCLHVNFPLQRLLSSQFPGPLSLSLPNHAWERQTDTLKSQGLR